MGHSQQQSTSTSHVNREYSDYPGSMPNMEPHGVIRQTNSHTEMGNRPDVEPGRYAHSQQQSTRTYSDYPGGMPNMEPHGVIRQTQSHMPAHQANSSEAETAHAVNIVQLQSNSIAPTVAHNMGSLPVGVSIDYVSCLMIQQTLEAKALREIRVAHEALRQEQEASREMQLELEDALCHLEAKYESSIFETTRWQVQAMHFRSIIEKKKHIGGKEKEKLLAELHNAKSSDESFRQGCNTPQDLGDNVKLAQARLEALVAHEALRQEQELARQVQWEHEEEVAKLESRYRRGSQRNAVAEGERSHNLREEEQQIAALQGNIQESMARYGKLDTDHLNLIAEMGRLRQEKEMSDAAAATLKAQLKEALYQLHGAKENHELDLKKSEEAEQTLEGVRQQAEHAAACFRRDVGKLSSTMQNLEAELEVETESRRTLEAELEKVTTELKSVKKTLEEISGEHHREMLLTRSKHQSQAAKISSALEEALAKIAALNEVNAAQNAYIERWHEGVKTVKKRPTG